ncbi:hypothetical protein SteCoe_5660 [Stentor coeruleus]|uniref:Protein kinase domain-containing protein n=1 Tax=Stentor coeruleus TaxID=5963 RepID=A0A1R2CRW6_9CILI|nr:hypothetical protein SteCoe_5660 [Stentor coeruleus]
MGCISIKNKSKKSKENKCLESKTSRIIPLNSEETYTSQLSDYITIEFLGAGSFAEVLTSKHIPSQTYRALKIITKSRLADQHINEQDTLKEISILQKLNHDKILNFYESFEDETCFYIATELCKGNTLYNKLKKQGKLQEPVAKNIMLQMLQAVDYIHSQGIVHRDLKPENILMNSGDSDDIKIADFGNACELNTSKGIEGCFGSLYYLAPEVFDGKYNEKVDIWSCGIIAYVLATGQPPFFDGNGTNIKEIVQSLNFEEIKKNIRGYSDDFTELLCRMLDINPENRISANEAQKHPWFSPQH